MLRVYVLEKVKTIFHFFGHPPKVVDKSFSVKMDAFWENLQRAPQFLLILTALFGHQPTYKNLRGNTASNCCVIAYVVL